MLDLLALAAACAPQVHPTTIRAMVSAYATHNELAIGVVAGALQRQPASLAEAVATAQDLEAKGLDFSIGLVQIDRRKLATYGLDYAQAFDPCRNLSVGAAILSDCYLKEPSAALEPQLALRNALSCYYGGGQDSGAKDYVQRVEQTHQRLAQQIPALDASPAPLATPPLPPLPPLPPQADSPPIPTRTAVAPPSPMGAGRPSVVAPPRQEGLPDAFQKGEGDAFANALAADQVLDMEGKHPE